MNTTASLDARPDWDRIQQFIKWLVYALLLINFGFYIVEDATRAMHTLHAGSTFLDWTGAFATSIDESAWFLLLAMFEIETYVLEDDEPRQWVSVLIHGVRAVCYVLLAHTIFAYAVAIVDLRPTVVVAETSSLCDLADTNLSWVYNLQYTEITAANCDSLSSASEFYRVGKDPVVADLAGLSLERNLALADLSDAILWLVAILAIEIVVRIQNHGIAHSPVITVLNSMKLAIYAAILGLGVYWATLSHWLYLWDEIMWIGGFAAIEMNLSDWRDELDEKQAIA